MDGWMEEQFIDFEIEAITISFLLLKGFEIEAITVSFYHRQVI